MSDLNTSALRQGIKAWHLALAIVAVGLALRAGLGALPQHTAQPVSTNATADACTPTSPAPAPADTNPQAIAVLPFDLQGEVPGPLLTSILQRYLPHSTSNHADDLRSTLPPGEDPRMIVIIPDQEKEGVF